MTKWPLGLLQLATKVSFSVFYVTETAPHKLCAPGIIDMTVLLLYLWSWGWRLLRNNTLGVAWTWVKNDALNTFLAFLWALLTLLDSPVRGNEHPCKVSSLVLCLDPLDAPRWPCVAPKAPACYLKNVSVSLKLPPLVWAITV